MTRCFSGRGFAEESSLVAELAIVHEEFAVIMVSSTLALSCR